MTTKNQPGDLTLEQQFTLSSISMALQSKPIEELKELVVELVRQDMVKTNLLKHLKPPFC